MPKVTICVPPNGPEQAAYDSWLKKWSWILQYASTNEGCGCCVNIYFVEAIPDLLADLPPELNAINSWLPIEDLERKYCRCIVAYPVSDADRLLLDQVIELHNQLLDNDISVSDALVQFTSIADALQATPHFGAFEKPLAELSSLLQSKHSGTELRDRASGCIYDLRIYAARQLRMAEERQIADRAPKSTK